LRVVLARSNGWNLVSHAGDPWVFNPLAWQLLFVFGAWCALGGARRFASLIRSRLVGIAAVAYLAFAFAIVMTWHVPALAELVPAWLSQVIYPIDKPNLDVMRIAHFLALAVLTVRFLRRESPVLHRRCCARRCAAVCAPWKSSVPACSCPLWPMRHWRRHRRGAAGQIMVSAVGIALLVAVAELIGWYRNAEKKRAPGSTGNAGLVQPVRMAPATA
jgi:OpgC protein